MGWRGRGGARGVFWGKRRAPPLSPSHFPTDLNCSTPPPPPPPSSNSPQGRPLSPSHFPNDPGLWDETLDLTPYINASAFAVRPPPLLVWVCLPSPLHIFVCGITLSETSRPASTPPPVRWGSPSAVCFVFPLLFVFVLYATPTST